MLLLGRNNHLFHYYTTNITNSIKSNGSMSAQKRCTWHCKKMSSVMIRTSTFEYFVSHSLDFNGLTMFIVLSLPSLQCTAAVRALCLLSIYRSGPFRRSRHPHILLQVPPLFLPVGKITSVPEL